MPQPIPTLGYRSRTAAVMGLREQGHDTGEIARRIGITRKTVLSLESARSRTGALPYLNLPPEAAEALISQAARRGTTPRLLAMRILAATLAEGLVEAVLDDEGPA